MKIFEWNEEKNQWIKENRNISFEEIVFFIENGGLLDTYEHPKHVGWTELAKSNKRR